MDIKGKQLGASRAGSHRHSLSSLNLKGCGMGVVFLQPGGNWGQGSSAPWEMCQERSPAAVRMETGRAGAHVEGVAVCVCVCRHRSLSPLASLPPAHTYHWLHSTGRQEGR